MTEVSQTRLNSLCTSLVNSQELWGQVAWCAEMLQAFQFPSVDGLVQRRLATIVRVQERWHAMTLTTAAPAMAFTTLMDIGQSSIDMILEHLWKMFY